jgi:PQQ-dependent catabolism-associated CXXCW motif protein
VEHRRFVRICVGLFAAIVLAAFALASGAAAAEPAEPSGYRTDDYRAPTPATLEGAKVISGDEAMALWQGKSAIFIDVMPRPRRPEGLPANTLWHVPEHRNIPGSIWLPNTGYGVLNSAADRYFRDNLARLSQDDKGAALVFYCLRDCWMSWNAAKRAIALGYGNVHWFPDGTEGWQEAGSELEAGTPVEPVP